MKIGHQQKKVKILTSPEELRVFAEALQENDFICKTLSMPDGSTLIIELVDEYRFLVPTRPGATG